MKAQSCSQVPKGKDFSQQRLNGEHLGKTRYALQCGRQPVWTRT